MPPWTNLNVPEPTVQEHEAELRIERQTRTTLGPTASSESPQTDALTYNKRRASRLRRLRSVSTKINWAAKKELAAPSAVHTNFDARLHEMRCRSILVVRQASTQVFGALEQPRAQSAAMSPLTQHRMGVDQQ